MLRGLDRRLAKESEVPVRLVDTPLECVVLGAGRCIESYESLREARAISLAEALMAEIVSLPYADPEGATTTGPDAGESTRADYDNIDDFDDFSEDVGAAIDAHGQAYDAPYDVFGRSVAVTYQTLTIAALGGALDGATIEVTVTDDRGRTWTLQRFAPEPAP